MITAAEPHEHLTFVPSERKPLANREVPFSRCWPALAAGLPVSVEGRSPAEAGAAGTAVLLPAVLSPHVVPKAALLGEDDVTVGTAHGQRASAVLPVTTQLVLGQEVLVAGSAPERVQGLAEVGAHVPPHVEGHVARVARDWTFGEG